MGMDVYGLNPTENSPEPEAVAKWIVNGWVDWKEMEKVKGAKEEYFIALEKWKEQNPGDYFRANVWWWRPLWECVAYFCDDILSKEDIERGTYNDGYEYDEKTAQKISDKLEEVIKNKKIHKFEKERNEYISNIEDKEDRKFYSNYKFDVDFVMDFAKFCQESGGFSIC